MSLTGEQGQPRAPLLSAAWLVLALSHVGSLWQPDPRMLVLHVAIIVGFFFVERSVGTADTPSGLAELGPVLVLLGLKTVVDLGLHLWERARASAGVLLGEA